MKKTFALMLAALLCAGALSLGGCGDDPVEPVSSENVGSGSGDIVSTDTSADASGEGSSEATRKDYSKTDAQPGLTEGCLAENFRVPTLTGEDFELANYRGKVVLILFWAEYGGEVSLNELKAMQSLKEQFAAEKDVVFLAINTADTAPKCRMLLEQNGCNMMNGVDLQREQQVGKQYGIQYLPASYLIDRYGVIRVVRRGSTGTFASQYAEQIQTILEEQ